MFTRLSLSRPLALWDLETTDRKIEKARIVEIGIVKVFPDGKRKEFSKRVNPGIPIPSGARAIHGIDDVRNENPFCSICEEVRDFLVGCDWAGFNIKKYDLPILENEFRRCGEHLWIGGRLSPEIVDVMEIDHSLRLYENGKRDLASCMRKYCPNKQYTPHRAIQDAKATGWVLDRMVSYYGLPDTVEGLANMALVGKV